MANWLRYRYRLHILLVLPPLCTAILYGWLFTRQGTLGCFLWGYQLPFIAFGLLSIAPILGRLAWEAIASIQPADASPVPLPPKPIESRAPVLSDLLGALASLIVLLLIVGLTIYLTATASTRLEVPPGLRLVEPAAGLIPLPTAGSPPGQDGPLVRVAISADPHFDRAASDHAGTTHLLATVRKGGYQAFFLLGDSVDSGLWASGWNRALAELASGLGPVPVRALLGNHDAVLDGEGHYRQAYFPDGMKSDSGSPFFFSIDAGKVRFFVLNLIWGSESFDDAQRQWLETSLASTAPDVYKVVLSHSYFRASGYVNSRSGQNWFDNAFNLRDVAPILSRHQVDLVVSGHNHFMEYLEGDGLHYALVGAMGGPSDSVPDHISPASRWLLRGTTGFLELAAWKDRLELVFRDSSGTRLFSRTVAGPGSERLLSSTGGA